MKGYRHRLWTGAGLLLLSAGLVALAGAFPQLTEQWYARWFYPILSKGLMIFTTRIPFSLAELIVVLVVLLIIVLLIGGIRCALFHSQRLADWWKGLLSSLVLTAGVVAVLFLLTGGLNYYRLTFTHYSGLEVAPSTVEELSGLCGQLIEEANALAGEVTRDDSGGMVITHDFTYTAESVSSAYAALADSFDGVLANGATARPKEVICSLVMSYCRITGGFFFFTGEANINTAVPDYSIPSTIAHELAHTCGFMREDEANYLAYLACEEADDPEVQYSGTMLALVHTINALASADREVYIQTVEGLSPQVWRDFALSSQYWDRYETNFGQFSEGVNDVYLRANSQEDGLRSYGRMVDLMLARYRKE